MKNQWQCIAASVCGASHQKSGQPCQDAHSWCSAGANVVVAAVADGAGSADLSEVGASIACSTAVQALSGQVQQYPLESDEDWIQALTTSLLAAKSAVESEAGVRSAEARRLASTLILAAVTPAVSAATQIGDGAAVIRCEDGSLRCLTSPQHGEYPNETVFLTSASAVENASFCVWRGEAAMVALFSDGLQSIALATDEQEPYPPFFEPLYRFAVSLPEGAQTALEEFLRSPRLVQRTDDDLTLLLMTRP